MLRKLIAICGPPFYWPASEIGRAMLELPLDVAQCTEVWVGGIKSGGRRIRPGRQPTHLRLRPAASQEPARQQGCRLRG